MPIHDWTRVDAGIFHAFHHNWITSLSTTLNAGLLPDGYYALPEQIAGGSVPDVVTLQRPSNGGAAGRPRGSVALKEAPPQLPYRATAADAVYARKANRVGIRHVSDHEVVAVLEIMSPGNKASARALRAFVKKAVTLLKAGVHLLVVDLFPPTRRDPDGIHPEIWGEVGGGDFSLPADKRLTCVAYRADDVAEAFLQPVSVGDPLPDMPVFLTTENYVPVPLETTYTSAWSAVPAYWRDVVGGKVESA